MTTARISQFTYSGVTVKAIVADPLACNVVSLGGSTLANAGYCGINGTFFDGSTGTTVGIAATAGGSGVTSTSGANNYGNYNRGTLIVL